MRGEQLVGVLVGVVSPTELAELESAEEVEIEPDAWRAVRALTQEGPRLRGLRQRVDRRRAEVFPSRTLDAPPDAAEGCSDCVVYTVDSARFVDAEEGDDDNSGTFGLAWRRVGGSSKLTLGLLPWKTLRRVEQWLNVDIYTELGVSDPSAVCVEGVRVLLRRGRAWTGREELDPDGTSSDLTYVRWWAPTAGSYGIASLLTVDGFHATEDGPLTFASYGPTTDAPPLIDGSTDPLGGSADPVYGDERTGLLFYGCCHVDVSGIAVRGFGTAIEVRGAARAHLFTGLVVHDNATYGVRIGVSAFDRALYADDAALVAAGAFPEGIDVIGCQLYANGYDTEGGDISLGYLAAGCEIGQNTMYGRGRGEAASARGVDGVVAQGASSGHDIYENTIYLHDKLCYERSEHKAVLVPPDVAATLSALPTGCASDAGEYATLLLHRCLKDTDTSGDCSSATPFGYVQLYYDVETGTDGEGEAVEVSPLVEAANAATGTMDAFGENGIDLKSVRDRTGDGDGYTVVRGNTIYGHVNSAGITIDDGSKGVYVFGNTVYANRNGILITNSENDGDWWDKEETEAIYVYRNLIVMNAGYGILVSSDSDGSGTAEVVLRVSGVYIVNNTVAHNYQTGLKVAIHSSGAAGDVDEIYVYNNLFMRNGLGGDYDEEKAEAVQVAWDKRIDLSRTARTTTFVSDYNAYLGWDRRAKTDGTLLDECVIRGASAMEDGRTTTGYVSEVRTIEMIGDDTYIADDGSSAPIWDIEAHGVQASSLADLGLTDAAMMEGIEYPSEGTPGTAGVYVSAAFYDLSEVSGDIDPIIALAESLLGGGSEYDIGDAASLLVDAGISATGAYASDLTTDLAQSNDYDDQPVFGGVPDIGAFEYQPPALPAPPWTRRP